MKIKLCLFVTLLSIVILLHCSQTGTNNDLAINYSVTINRPETKPAQVDMTVSGIRDKSLTLKAPAQFEWMDIYDVLAVDGAGNELDFREKIDIKEVSAGRRRKEELRFYGLKINTGGGSTIKVSYKVKVNYQRRGEYYGYLSSDFGLLSGMNLFLVPEKRVEKITLKFKLPEGWKAAVPWEKQGDGYTVDAGKELLVDELINSAYGFGNFVKAEKNIAGTDVTIHTMAGREEKDRKELVESMFDIYRYFVNLTGYSPGKKYTIVFVPKLPGGAVTFIPAWSNGQGKCMYPAVTSDWRYLAEDIFRRWNTYAPYNITFKNKKDRWFIDGSAVYYAMKSLLETGRISRFYFDEYFYTMLSNYSGTIKRFDRKAMSYYPQDDANLEKLYKLNYPVLYSTIKYLKAPLFTWLLDENIKNNTNPFSLDDVVKYQFKTKIADLKKDITGVTSFDPADFFARRIEKDEFNTGETYLVPDNFIFTSQKKKLKKQSENNNESIHISFLVNGNTYGFLETCGCPVNKSGGLPRRGTVIDSLKAAGEDPIVLELGNSTPRGEEEEFTGKEIKSYFTALEIMNYDGYFVGLHDLAEGKEFVSGTLGNLKIPVISANLSGFKTNNYIIKKRKGITFGISGINSPVPDGITLTRYYENKIRDYHMNDIPEYTKNVIARLSDKSDFIVLCGSVTPYMMRKIIRSNPEINMFINLNGNLYLKREIENSFNDEAGFINNTLVIYSRSIQYWSDKIDLLFSKDKKLVNWNYSLILLHEGLKENKEVREHLDSFYSSFEHETNFSPEKLRLFKNEELENDPLNYYTGSENCLECHKETEHIEKYSMTKHKYAYNTLLKRHSNFYPKCIACHTTGYGYAAGFDIKKEDKEKFAGVGCESCHGPGGRHEEALKADKNTEQKYIRTGQGERICRECHDIEHSPHFDYEKYKSKVRK